MPQINLLDKEVYELIAAGEVIERPASIVKELIENAIDADASSVTVEIKNGGRSFLRVADNGVGIAYEDVPKAFLRHATSKVAEKADLEHIMTMGFRGEALASVCAVARVEMFTRLRGEMFGTHYEIAASEQKTYDVTGCPEGTSVIVRDLFYNVPARLKFLKKDATEANRIQELMSRLAVSHPDISFKLIRDNKPVFVTAGDGKLYSAIYSVFGRDFAKGLLPVSYERGSFSAEGYVSKPLDARTNRKFQVFYVNGRYVHSEVCSQALEEAYKSRIMIGRFPMCVMKLTLPPDMLDVNVHPAKTEVRFSDNRFVYDSVYFAARQALEEQDKPTRLTIDRQKRFSDSELYADNTPKAEQMVFSVPEEPEIAVPVYNQPAAAKPDTSGDDLFLKSLDTKQVSAVKPIPYDEIGFSEQPKGGSLDDDEFVKMLDGLNAAAKAAEEEELPLPPVTDEPQESVPQAADVPETADEGASDSADMLDKPVSADEPVQQETLLENFSFVTAEDMKQRRPVRIDPIPESEQPKPKEKPRVIGELFKTYIVTQVGDQMVLIDKHAAHERHIYEQIRFDARTVTAQMLLEPIMVMLSFDEYDAVSANLERIEKLGFVIEPDVAPAVAVKALPQLLKQYNPTEMIVEIAQKLITGGSAMPQLYDDIYRSMACKAAVKAHDDNTIEELQHLAELVYEEDLRYCPHGRPVRLEMSEYEIEKHFRRIV
ncbi:DNA mismatch repair protein MutL [Ruminococcus sp. YE71]|uniref:DNA mismatch repair endonuclease MutL n=1 Tax=unclassified Ruminococcus TaxID=2608920 RepID=UPI000891A261|nr:MULTISPECIES: DNA mismatch repair endonuclease MutL [unclassified Ruminococcus]SDA13689.1 DNA mismatch repair protein MutL [Ruminococcus sp. YE78]SFW19499.1 DNA mismatch repair protein MutL [Ruminococcus sp. YE71]